MKKNIALFFLVLFSLTSAPRELWHFGLVHAREVPCNSTETDFGSIKSPDCAVCHFQLQHFTNGKVLDSVLFTFRVFNFFSSLLPQHNVLWGECIALRGPPALF